MPLSPILSNLYLSEFDRTCEKMGISAVRYADDLLVYGSSYNEISELESFVKSTLRTCGLDLKDTKTSKKGPGDRVDFLGFTIELDDLGTSYRKAIPKSAFKTAADNLIQMADYRFVRKKYGSLSRTLVALRSKERSYISAYSTGYKIESFSDHLSTIRQDVIKELFSEIFGKESVGKLGYDELAFLGAEDKKGN